MPRMPRLEYSNAIYHIVARGDGRRRRFDDAGHYDRFTQGLVDEVDRSSWTEIAYCWMANDIHALIRTSHPNLCRGMQHWLSGYSNAARDVDRIRTFSSRWFDKLGASS